MSQVLSRSGAVSLRRITMTLSGLLMHRTIEVGSHQGRLLVNCRCSEVDLAGADVPATGRAMGALGPLECLLGPLLCQRDRFGRRRHSLRQL